MFYTPERVGKIGEDKIAKDLGVLDLFGYKGYCLQNLYIPMSDGNTSEIDVLYLTQKGLFVIEIKKLKLIWKLLLNLKMIKMIKIKI